MAGNVNSPKFYWLKINPWRSPISGQELSDEGYAVRWAVDDKLQALEAYPGKHPGSRFTGHPASGNWTGSRCSNR